MGIVRQEDRDAYTAAQSSHEVMTALSLAMPEITAAIQSHARTEIGRLGSARRASCIMPTQVFSVYRGRRFWQEATEAIRLAMVAIEPKTYKVYIIEQMNPNNPPWIHVDFDPRLT